MATKAMKLSALRCSDKGWTGAGFSVQKSMTAIGDVDVHFVPGNGGLIAWGWDGLPEGINSLCGVPTFAYTRKTEAHVENPNGATSIDHIVLHTNDATFVKQEFARVGVTARAERNDIYPGITQIFFRPGGGTVVEVVVNEGFPRALLWGLTVVVRDIDTAKAQLKDNASEPKKAVQPGRKIMTVRHANLQMATNMAMMTPHVKISKPKILIV